jgi:adenine-specific DNA-methyltransferase
MPGARLELTWPNKDKFLLVPKDETGKPVWVDRGHPAASEVRITDFTDAVGDVNADDPYADNLLFVGDSLDALRVLAEVPEYRQQYRGTVKCIYIDPPFNTGVTFEHYDDWMEHSTWLSFMRDRLLLMKELLAPNGSLWVHLDDSEQHRMRCLLDEVFGADAFVANIVWQKADSPRMDTKTVSVSHDIISVYRKSPAFMIKRFVLDGPQDHYDKVADDGRRYYTKPLRYGGQGDARADRPNLHFPIAAPDGTLVVPKRPDGSDGRWRWSHDKVAAEADRLEWVRSRDGGWTPYFRIYAGETTAVPAQSIWTHQEAGSNRTSAAESKALGGGSKFATPKPERLLERVAHLATEPGDIVLDCFGGSGTTAAVAHKMGRRWVTVEILPSTVSEFTQPRLDKVVNGEDPGGITDSAGWAGGGGFRVVTVGPSMYEVTPVGVMLADWATNGRFARAVAGQLGFEWQPKKHAPFCGVRGRMRLAVFDGAVGVEEAQQVVSALGEKERVTIVAKAILPGVEEFLAETSRGSRVRKAPRDVLTERSRARRRKDPAS